MNWSGPALNNGEGNWALSDHAAQLAPMVVSFAFGDEYYLRAADTLRADCVSMGVETHIVRAELPAGTSWIDACRYKVRFVAECVERFDRPLWWVDVDCRLLRALPDLGASVDLGFFLRGFRDFRQFDPALLPRVLQPSILYFGRTPAAREFVALMALLEREHQGVATDDWFLHEAWTRLPQAPVTTVLPPTWVRLEDQTSTLAVFDFGRSGSAAQNKGLAEQHEVELFSAQRRKALFMREVAQALRDKKTAEAQFFLRKAQQADPADEALAYRVARGWLRERRADEAELILSQLPSGANAADHVRRFRLDAALDAADDVAAARVAGELIAGPSDADRQWAQGRQLRIGLASRARQARLGPVERPQLWWMEGPCPGNFGDILNPYVVEKLTGLPPIFGPKGAGVLAIGSTIRFARDGSQVWGTGTPRMSDRLNPRAVYLAVRGPLTARLVQQSGGRAHAVFGDPACLLPRLYRPRPAAQRFALGVVLHHAHEGRLQFDGDVKVISVLRAGYDGIEAFIDELCQCERVLTSSLHGLIVSHAYGIPAQWFTVAGATDAVPGDGTKYHDYLLSVGLPCVEPLVLSDGSEIHPRVQTRESLATRPVDLDALLEVAPWKVRARATT
jgi:hypothetical protein